MDRKSNRTQTDLGMWSSDVPLSACYIEIRDYYEILNLNYVTDKNVFLDNWISDILWKFYENFLRIKGSVKYPKQFSFAPVEQQKN